MNLNNKQKEKIRRDMLKLLRMEIRSDKQLNEVLENFEALKKSAEVDTVTNEKSCFPVVNKEGRLITESKDFTIDRRKIIKLAGPNTKEDRFVKYGKEDK